MKTLVGTAGKADLLVGDAGGSIFKFQADGTWGPKAYAVNTGDPGHPGPQSRHQAPNHEGSSDVFRGVDGVHDVLVMGDGKRLLYLNSGGWTRPSTARCRGLSTSMKSGWEPAGRSSI